GEVRAMVGGRDFDKSNFNRATQAKRQPGSAFKPFVYAAALEQGFTPGTVLTNLDDPIMTLQGAWVPEDEHSEGSSMTMRAALKTSSNRAAVRMLEDVGIPVTVDYAKRLGVGSVPSVPSLALGSGEVTLSSMTAAYAAFANGGMVQAPMLVRRVETTQGEVLYTAKQEPQQAVSEQTAFLMSNMMADVIKAGTGGAPRAVSVSPSQPLARPARRTITMTRGSWASRRSSQRVSGSGTTNRARSSGVDTRPSSPSQAGDASWRRPLPRIARIGSVHRRVSRRRPFAASVGSWRPTRVMRA